MPLTAALQRFVDDELARMPALIEQVRRQTVDTLRQADERAVSPGERMLRFDLARALETSAQRFCDAFLAALSHRVRGESEPAAEVERQTGPRRGLALVDDVAHGADIEIARVAAAIAGAAEWELRELQTYTSALCGLPYVSVTSNPLRPDAFAAALSQAADTVPLARRNPTLLRVAANPLAEALRRAFAAACTRLDNEGVQPSLYRTAVPKQGERASELGELLDSIPDRLGSHEREAAAHARAGASAQSRGSTAAHAVPASARKADAARLMLLTSLFDAIAQGSQMHPALRTLTGLLQRATPDLAAREPELLESASHPLWQLLDRFAYQSATHPDATDPQLLAWIGFAAELVARMQAQPLPDAQLYRSSVEQLDAYSAAQFNMLLQQAATDIETLRRAEPGAAGTLNIGSMDTVPSELLSGAAAPVANAQAAAWLQQQVPGSWYRLFLRGRWTVMRLLWQGAPSGRWLFAGQYPQRNDAFDHDTLVRLRAEALIRPFVERALVVRAAESVRRQLTDRRRAG